MSTLLEISQVVSQWAVPLILLTVILAAWWRRVPMYESFVSGAKEGFDVAVMIIPYLVAILSVIAVFRASGALHDMAAGLAWCMGKVGLGQFADKVELLPLILIRPLSGSGARGVMLDLFKVHGPDSWIGWAATVIQGSTETTFYILTVYFGAVAIRKIRHSLPACLIGELVGAIAALTMTALFYH